MIFRIAAEYPENEDAEEPRASKAIAALKEICTKLPKAHRDTLAFLMNHLSRVTSESDSNGMPSSNLGIVFGPTLLRSGDGNPSLNSLIDTCYQTRAIEILIVHAGLIFGNKTIAPAAVLPSSSSPVIPQSTARPPIIP